MGFSGTAHESESESVLDSESFYHHAANSVISLTGGCCGRLLIPVNTHIDHLMHIYWDRDICMVNRKASTRLVKARSGVSVAFELMAQPRCTAVGSKVTKVKVGDLGCSCRACF